MKTMPILPVSLHQKTSSNKSPSFKAKYVHDAAEFVLSGDYALTEMNSIGPALAKEFKKAIPNSRDYNLVPVKFDSTYSEIEFALFHKKSKERVSGKWEYYKDDFNVNKLVEIFNALKANMLVARRKAKQVKAFEQRTGIKVVEYQ